MKLPNEPRGWRYLQALAQSAPDTETLTQVIEEMHRILDEQPELDMMADFGGRKVRDKIALDLDSLQSG